MKKQMVVGFMFNRKGTELVLIEKKKPDWQKGLLNGVGGKVEALETPIGAMVREFEEETGVHTEEDMWQPFAKMEGDDWEVYCLCGFSNVLYQTKTMEEEVIVRHTLANPLPNAISNIPVLIELALLRRENDGFNVAVLDYRKETI